MLSRLNQIENLQRCLVELGYESNNPDLLKANADSIDEAQMQAIEAKDLEIIQEMDISIKYEQMVSDIYSEMLKVFGTTNDVSAAATVATYEAMIKRPANYVDPSLGLADETAVTALAQSKLNESDAYGVFRLARIAQFQSEKEAILDA